MFSDRAEVSGFHRFRLHSQEQTGEVSPRFSVEAQCFSFYRL